MITDLLFTNFLSLEDLFHTLFWSYDSLIVLFHNLDLVSRLPHVVRFVRHITHSWQRKKQLHCRYGQLHAYVALYVLKTLVSGWILKFTLTLFINDSPVFGLIGIKAVSGLLEIIWVTFF